jgi:hypothetical protein
MLIKTMFKKIAICANIISKRLIPLNFIIFTPHGTKKITSLFTDKSIL